MMTTAHRRALATAVAAALALLNVCQAAATSFDAELAAIQAEWARINYQVRVNDARIAAFDQLTVRSHAFSSANPKRAEALIWEGIVLSTAAGAKGGLGALGLAKQARDRLEAALALDPKALQGSAHTSLGTLYHKVPGFPLGFGSDKKAAEHFRQALAQNPDGIDPNFFYGEFLYDEGEPDLARKHLEKALLAAPRPGRESADAGRRQEIQALLARVRAELD